MYLVFNHLKLLYKWSLLRLCSRVRWYFMESFGHQSTFLNRTSNISPKQHVILGRTCICLYQRQFAFCALVQGLLPGRWMPQHFTKAAGRENESASIFTLGTRALSYFPTVPFQILLIQASVIDKYKLLERFLFFPPFRVQQRCSLSWERVGGICSDPSSGGEDP